MRTEVAVVRSRSKIDRLLFFALGLSLGGHALVIGVQVMRTIAGGLFEMTKPVKFIYEPKTTHPESQWSKELNRRGEKLGELPRPSFVSAPGASAGGYSRGALGVDALDDAGRVRIGGGFGGGSASLALPSGSTWAAAIDLTNLTAAAQGDPVLYSYYGAIREQIQQTANERQWVPSALDTAGVVYVGFVVTRTGAIESAGVVSERSVRSAALQTIALRIIKASSPFLPFPPSFQEPTKTIVVPIEFSPVPSG